MARPRWQRVVLWSVVGLILVVLACGGGFYLWFQKQVGAANARVDPDIVAALQEKPTTSTGTSSTSASHVGATSTSVVTGSTQTAVSSTTTLQGTTTSAPYEAPSGMNLILVGYDERAEGSSEVTEGRSDVMILVHIDPEKGFLSLLSVPRDLRAVVKGYGHRKINAAYAFGGGALLVRTIQDTLGVDLDHYIAVNLEAFKAITDSIGGVYVDVDRTYDDGKIELDPGYQLLDGLNSERFCRTRHDQNVDFGRMARQQRFLSAIRQQVITWNLPLKLPGLIKTIFKYADTDLSANEVLKLAYWVTKLDGGGIKRAEIIAATGQINGAYYVLPTEDELASAVKDFFTPPTETETTETTVPQVAGPAALATGDLSGLSVEVVNGTGVPGQGALAAIWLQRQGASIEGISRTEDPVDAAAVVQYPSGREEAAQRVAHSLGILDVERTSAVDRVTVLLGDLYGIEGSQLSGTSASAERTVTWSALQRESGLALLVPTYMPSDFSFSFDRSYDLDTGDGDEPAARVGYRFKSEDLYAGVSATAWTDAPLASPGVEVEAAGVTYTAVGASNATDHVWWTKDGVLYWVSNTLFSDLTREEMLAIAISTVAVPAE